MSFQLHTSHGICHCWCNNIVIYKCGGASDLWTPHADVQWKIRFFIFFCSWPYYDHHPQLYLVGFGKCPSQFQPLPRLASACGGVTVLDCLWNTGSEVCTVFSELVLISAGSGWSGLLRGLVTFALQLFVSLVFCWCLQLLMEAAVTLALLFWLFSDDMGLSFSSHWLCVTLWSLWILGHASNHQTSVSEVLLSSDSCPLVSSEVRLSTTFHSIPMEAWSHLSSGIWGLPGELHSGPPFA